MHKARHGKELVLRMANDVDTLAKVSKLIAERGVNILAMSCWEERGDVVMRLVTDDILRTSDVLRENGHEPKCVLWLPLTTATMTSRHDKRACTSIDG